MATGRMGTARRAVTAFFDDRAAAQQAVDDLVAAKVSRHSITLVEGGAAPAASEPVPTSDKGIWSTVRDLFMADEDRHAYGEGLRRGGFLLSVMLSGSDAARIVEILDREGAVDMDARQGDWELEGWDPVRASADLETLGSSAAPAASAPSADAVPSAEAVRDAMEPAAPVGPAFGAGATPAREPARRTVKRDPDADGLRLRTYVESHDHPDAMR